MALLGTGMMPGGALGAQMSAVTRRAFIPKLVNQMGNATPTLSLLYKGAQKARGGVSQITVPVQGSSFFPNSSFIGFDGTFNQPTDQTPIQNAQFNVALMAQAVGLYGAEALIQSTEAVIPLIKAKMADIKFKMTQDQSNALFAQGAYATPTGLYANSLNQAYDDGTNYDTYGGISRASNAFWKGQLVTNAGAILTRKALMGYIMQCTTTAGGESPNAIIMSPADWTTLLQDYMSIEQYNTGPGNIYGKDDVVNAGFRGLMLGNVPIFADNFCPVGTIYMLNTRYLNMYIHEDAAFAFSGFHSTIPNMQVANIGVLLHGYNVVCTKPSSGMMITGVTGGAFTPPANNY